MIKEQPIKYKSYLYLPIDFDLEKLLQDNNIRQYYFYHYAYIISTLYLREVIDKRNKDQFIPLNYKELKGIISKRKTTEILNYLIRWGILERDNHYYKGIKSIGYRINKDTPPLMREHSDTNTREKGLQTLTNTNSLERKNLKINENKRFKFKRIELKDKLICKKLRDFRIKRINDMKSRDEVLHQLYINLTNIKIDHKEAFKYIRETYSPLSNEYASRELSIQMIRDGNWFFNRDETGNRVHTNLTNLSGDLRRFLSFGKQTLGQVDITNSQPFFLAIALKKMIDVSSPHYEEYLKYKNIVERGQFYEEMMTILEYTGTRDEFKKFFFQKILFGRNNKKLNKEEMAFKEVFPEIFRLIRLVKKNDHSQLAISLQREESKTIIDDCIGRIIEENPGTFVLTIHDSIVCLPEDISYVGGVIEDAFIKHNIIPKLQEEVF